MTSQKGTIKIILLIIIVALVAALVYVVAVPKSERNGTPAPGQNSPPSPLFSKEGKGEFQGWKTYRNEEYGFELRYPSGEVGQGFKNAYLVGIPVAGIFVIDIFTDQSVNEWNASIARAIEKNEPIGDPATLPYPLSVKTLLSTNPVSYDCTADFGEYLSKNRNESCDIVEINGVKAFKIIASGPFQSEVSEIKYIFHVNNIWFDASKRFWIYNEKDPSKQLYTYKELNAILQGKVANPAIKADTDLFGKVLSTFKFTPHQSK